MEVGCNDLLSPAAATERTYTWWEFASLWVGLVVGVPNYYLAGSLVELGMTWQQGISIIILANTITLVPLLLTAAAGTRHGIPFPVLTRASFGLRGAHVPTLLRALVACGWFGIETWIGGQSIFLLVPWSWSSTWMGQPLPFLGTSPIEFTCFMAFWVIQMAVLWKGMEGILWVNKYSAPVLILLTAVLFSWAVTVAGGLGVILSSEASLPPSEFWPLFFPSLTANIGSWSSLALNIPDFSRYARSQADQITGQAGLPIFMGAFTFVGLAVTSASSIVFGAPISDPLLLVREIIKSSGGFTGSVIALVSAIGVSLATITTNVPANVVASANALVDLNPSVFSFGRAATATALIGIAFQPWRLFGSSGSFVETWLVGYASVTGPMSGILLADYYLVRRTKLEVGELYSSGEKGAYYYWKGYNPKAMAAFLVAFAPMLPGFLHQVGLLPDVALVFRWIYGVSWFFGFFSAAAIYWALASWNRCRGNPKKAEPLLGIEEAMAV